MPNEEFKENIEKVLKMNRTLLDTIYDSCKTNADIYKVDYVPLSYLKMVHDLAFSKLSESMRNGANNIGQDKG